MAMSNATAETPLHTDDSARHRVAESALKLFAAKGYAETSVREIIEAAGVTRPVLYYHFVSKAELFCCLIEAEFARLYQEMDAILARRSGCQERLKALIGLVFDGAERSPETVRLLLRFFFAPPDEPMRIDSEQLAQERFARVTKIMEDGLASGEIGGGEAGALALAFSGLMDMHVMGKARHPEVKLSPALGDALVDLFMDGARGATAARTALPHVFGPVLSSSATRAAGLKKGKRKP